MLIYRVQNFISEKIIIFYPKKLTIMRDEVPLRVHEENGAWNTQDTVPTKENKEDLQQLHQDLVLEQKTVEKGDSKCLSDPLVLVLSLVLVLVYLFAAGYVLYKYGSIREKYAGGFTVLAIATVSVVVTVLTTKKKEYYSRCKPGVDMLNFIPFVNFFTEKIQKPPRFEENVKEWMKQTEDYLKCDVRNENKEFRKIVEWFSGFRSVHQCSVNALNSIAEMGAVASLNVLSNAWRDIGEFGRLVWLQPDAAEYARRELGEKEKEREREAAQRYVKAYCRIVQGERSPKIVNSVTSSPQYHNTTRH